MDPKIYLAYVLVLAVLVMGSAPAPSTGCFLLSLAVLVEGLRGWDGFSPLNKQIMLVHSDQFWIEQKHVKESEQYCLLFSNLSSEASLLSNITLDNFISSSSHLKEEKLYVANEVVLLS